MEGDRMPRGRRRDRTLIVLGKLEEYESENLGRPISIQLENPDARQLIVAGLVLINLGRILALAGAKEARKVLEKICSEFKGEE